MLERDEIQRLEVAAGTERDKLIVRLLVDTGMRAGELAGIRLDDLIEQGRDRFVRVRGKGRKERFVSVLPDLYRRLRKYAQSSRPEAPDRAPIRVPAAPAADEVTPASSPNPAVSPPAIRAGGRANHLRCQTMRLVMLVSALGLVLLTISLGIHRNDHVFGQAASQPATTAVPATSDFSLKVTGCTGSEAAPIVQLNLHDSYPGPLVIVFTQTVTPRANSQPFSGTLEPGDNALTGPATADQIQIAVQVQNGEGAVAFLTVNRSSWINLCPAPAAPVTGTGPD